MEKNIFADFSGGPRTETPFRAERRGKKSSPVPPSARSLFARSVKKFSPCAPPFGREKKNPSRKSLKVCGLILVFSSTWFGFFGVEKISRSRQFFPAQIFPPGKVRQYFFSSPRTLCASGKFGPGKYLKSDRRRRPPYGALAAVSPPLSELIFQTDPWNSGAARHTRAVTRRGRLRRSGGGTPVTNE